MKPFNIAQVLADAGVNNDTSARKQIEYIPIGQIEADPGNFYALPKLEELANSISIIGLQEPVVVRPVEDGRYRIISGHRRTAALRILIERGDHDDKVMCIVERQQESEALTQLKLIMGNSENRVLTSAEQARQVEETQQLIYQLKKEGFDFSGRVRDYVSDICKISTGKIARLNVIRSQLVPGFLNIWEAGKLKDSVAYALAKQPPVRQNAVKHFQMDGPGRDEFPCSEDWLENIFSEMDKVESDCKLLSCDDTTLGNCDHVAVRVNRAASIGRYGWISCIRCCKDCASLQSCSFSCGHADGIKAEKKAVEKAANQRAKEEQKERDRPKKDILADVYSRVKDLRAEKAISAPDFCKASSGYDCKSEIDALAELESGKVQLTKRLPGGIWPDEAFRLIATADLLGCSIDYLLGRTDVKGVPAAPAAEPEKCVKVDTWHTGEPPKPGDYIGLIRYTEKGRLVPDEVERKEGQWLLSGLPIDDAGITLVCWTEYPELPKSSLNSAIPASDVPNAASDNVSTLTPDSAYEDSCITGMSGSGRCGAAHYCSEPHDCCLQCDKDCSARCGWIGNEEDA